MQQALVGDATHQIIEGFVVKMFPLPIGRNVYVGYLCQVHMRCSLPRRLNRGTIILLANSDQDREVVAVVRAASRTSKNEFAPALAGLLHLRDRQGQVLPVPLPEP